MYRIFVQSLTLCSHDVVPYGPTHRSFHHALMWGSVNLPDCYGTNGDWYWFVGRLVLTDDFLQPYETENN